MLKFNKKIILLGFACGLSTHVLPQSHAPLLKVLKTPEVLDTLLYSPQTVCEAQDPCSDLYGATCNNPDGTLKDDLKLDDFFDEKIQGARDAAVKALGQESLAKAYQDFLGRNGFLLKDSLSEDELKALLKDPNVADLSKYFSNQVDCSEDSKKSVEVENIEAILGDSKPKSDYTTALYLVKFVQDEINVLNAKVEVVKGKPEAAEVELGLKFKKEAQAGNLKKLEEAKKAYEAQVLLVEAQYAVLNEKILTSTKSLQEQSIKNLKKEPSTFLAEYFSLCSSAPGALQATKEEELSDVKQAASELNSSSGLRALPNDELRSLDFSKACDTKVLYEMRKTVVKLQTVSDTVVSQSLITDLVESHYQDYFKMKDFNENHYAFEAIKYYGLPKPAGEIKNERMRRINTRACNVNRTQAQATYRNIYGKFLGNLAKSKPAVEYVISEAYSDEKKVIIEKLFSDSKAGLLDLLDTEFAQRPELKDSPKMKKIKDGLLKLSYFWAKNPQESQYIKLDDFPLPVIENDQYMPDEFLAGFEDPSLDFIKELNAHYSPALAMGEVLKPEEITILPAMNFLAQKDPYGVMMVLAHELGHKIGPAVSSINGHDLRDSYKSLLKCLASDESIHMNKDQQDETIADWISSKILGKYIAGLPEGQRKPAVLQLGALYCEIGLKTFYSSVPDMKEAHPEQTLRVNGIFGTNANIRKALGCQEVGPIKECTLDGDKK